MGVLMQNESDRCKQLDRLNEVITDIEDRLAAKYAMAARVMLDSNRSIAWARYAREWQIVFFDGSNRQPLTTVRADWRVEAARKIPELVEQLKARAQSGTSEVTEATDILQKLVRELET